MKKLSFFLMAMLVSMTSFAAALGEGYSKVTDITTLSAGDKVVLYCDDAELGVTGWDGNKTATAAAEGWVEYVVEAAEGGVLLKDGDKYVDLTAKNSFHYTATGGVCKVTADGILYITLSGSDYLLYENANNGSPLYRMYVDKTGNAQYKPFYVYKKAAVVEPVKLYLNAKDWGYGDARFAAYFFDPAKWVDMTKVEGEAYIYEVEVPAGYTKVIFVRMNGSTTENNWSNKWNQTGNLDIPTDGKNMFKPDGWEGETTTWSTYTPSVKYTFTQGSTWYIDFSAITGKKGANYPKADAADIDYSATAGGTVIPVTFTADVTWAEGATFIKTEEGGWDALTFTTPTEGANCAQVAADGKSYTWTTYAPVVTYDVTVADATVSTMGQNIVLSGNWEEKLLTVSLWQGGATQGFGTYAAEDYAPIFLGTAELTPTSEGVYADNGDNTFTFTATANDADGGIYNISVTGAIPADEPEINWIEMPLAITNLTTSEIPVGDQTVLQLTGRNDMEDSDVMLFLNNYTGEEKAYEVNAESSVMTFGGMEFTVMDGSITKSVDPEKGDVFAGTVHASVVDEEVGEMYVEFALTMYALPPVELEIIDAVASVDEATGRLVLTAEWTDTVSMVTYPVSITVAGYNEADLEETGFVEYEAAQVSEIQIGDDDNWFDFAVANAVAVFKDGNAVAIEAEYTSWDTGATYYVYAGGEMQGGEDPEYFEMQDKITNLTIDTDNMVIIGGPSTMWQIEVYLGLAEDDNMDGQWSLSPESSVTIMGFDARFVDGYVYDIDVNAPAAKAVLHVEDNGTLCEIKLDMTSTPKETVVIVVEDALVEVEEWKDFPEAPTSNYALTMTADWTNEADNMTYPVKVEVLVYDPNVTEQADAISNVVVGENISSEIWLAGVDGCFLNLTTVDGVITAKGVVTASNGVALDLTISGKLPATALDNIQVGNETMKVIRDGQLIIIKNDVEYNIQGATLK